MEEVETAMKQSAFMKRLKKSRSNRAAFEKSLFRGMTHSVHASFFCHLVVRVGHTALRARSDASVDLSRSGLGEDEAASALPNASVA